MRPLGETNDYIIQVYISAKKPNKKKQHKNKSPVSWNYNVQVICNVKPEIARQLLLDLLTFYDVQPFNLNFPWSHRTFLYFCGLTKVKRELKDYDYFYTFLK